MKPWTWQELADTSISMDTCNPFVKMYGKIGAVALELANRLAFPEDTGDSFYQYTKTCGCGMCKQWHGGWSNDQVNKLYAALYKKAYGK